MRKGELVRTVDDWTVFEGIGYRASDQDRVTEHLVRAGWRDGGSTSGSEAWERGWGGAPGDKYEEVNT